MTAILQLLAGITLAALVFAATLWSAYRIYQQPGRTRWVHGALLALTLAGMAALDAVVPVAAQVVGGALIVAAGAGAWVERGSSRLLPLAQGVFGVALLLRLPFQGG